MKKFGALLLGAGLLGLVSCGQHTSTTSTPSASSLDSMVNQATSEVGGTADSAGAAIKQAADSLTHAIQDSTKK